MIVLMRDACACTTLYLLVATIVTTAFAVLVIEHVVWPSGVFSSIDGPRAQKKCWVALPSGCDHGLSETSTPYFSFVDPGSPSKAVCLGSRKQEFNRYCGRRDAQAVWSAASPPGANARARTSSIFKFQHEFNGFLKDTKGAKYTGYLNDTLHGDTASDRLGVRASADGGLTYETVEEWFDSHVITTWQFEQNYMLAHKRRWIETVLLCGQHVARGSRVLFLGEYGQHGILLLAIVRRRRDGPRHRRV